ncbi:MAG: dTMP kinase [Chloroflexi bacterium]|jgi:dTMP kinase|nr:MAG: dTMP kinase [Chloroflexota bacterium]
MANKGIFITLEGGEGVGKTTQAQRIESYFTKMNKKVILLREPGGTKTGEKVREIIRETKEPIAPITELLLFSAARKEHIEKIITPHLHKNYIVICDRFIDSTVAYQHYGRKIPIRIVKEITQLATDGLQPDISILLEMKFQDAIKRKKEELDYLEKTAMQFHEDVLKGYNTIIKKEPKRWIKVDANLPKDLITTIIINKLEEMIKKIQ